MTTHITTDLQAMLDQATPGNWLIWSDFDDSTWTIGPAGGISVAELIGNHTDARLIAAAPDLAQRVIDQDAELQRLREGIEALADVLGRISKPGTIGHGASQDLRALLEDQ